MTEDLDIRQRITSLADEEHTLRQQLSDHRIGVSEEHERLRAVETELDQCWDLLRQRDARRNAGEDPADAEVRPASVVENYRN
ncbi:MAG: DUF2630 family protein [Nocardioides sp.]|uniref:DUF2630 family protein n=1 Tax=Nocardioides sp. TaxID=35761 RepID=UPI0039E63B4B